MNNLAVLDTNVVMDLLLLDDIEKEKDTYFEMLTELERDYAYNINVLRESKPTSPVMVGMIADHLLKRRMIRYNLVKDCVDRYLSQYNCKPCLTKRIVRELTNNLTKNGETFEVDLEALKAGDKTHFDKVLSRFTYYRFKEQVNSITSKYTILSDAPKDKVFLSYQDIGSGDPTIYNSCIYHNVTCLITNNVSHFDKLNKRYSKKIGKSLLILPTYHTQKDFDKQFNKVNESHALKVTYSVVEEYLTSIGVDINLL